MYLKNYKRIWFLSYNIQVQNYLTYSDKDGITLAGSRIVSNLLCKCWLIVINIQRRTKK